VSHSAPLKDLKHNFLVNVIDGGFFGFAVGFASFVTVIPLFVSMLTDSAILIGLIPAIHNVGWQLPQLLTAQRVSRQKRLKPMVLWLTIHERLPFIGLALVAWLLPGMATRVALPATFLLLVWQGVGGGITATAWQSLMAKIIPGDRRATFFGAQMAAANFLAFFSAIFAGYVLDQLPSPLDYTICFVLASLMMLVSWGFLALTREPDTDPLTAFESQADFWSGLREILRRDVNFRWYLAARMLMTVGSMAVAFFTVHAVKNLGMSELQVGFLTAVNLFTQVAINPLMGWFGDKFSRRLLMEIGAAAAVASALIAWFASSPGWFYLAYILAGVASVASITIGLAMILEFGSEAERPAYIGLANTLVAPVTILAPFFGGWLADRYGYPAAFIASAAGGALAVLTLHARVRDPQPDES
jgi:MFS family permease